MGMETLHGEQVAHLLVSGRVIIEDRARREGEGRCLRLVVAGGKNGCQRHSEREAAEKKR